MAEMRVQVCYARPNRSFLREVALPVGATVETAIRRSGLLAEVPEIDLDSTRVGIYGKLKTADAVLRHGDRVEIYRPLVGDPKESRRKRAVKRDEKGRR